MHIRQVDFEVERTKITKIRFNVFVKEQHVPEELEMDDRDPFCIHLLAFESEEAVGTCRLDIEKLGKVGRLAVVSSKRGQGIGTALMKKIHEVAREHSLSKTWCHAQLSVVPFYENLEYQAIGERFYEADIEHIKMEKKI